MTWMTKEENEGGRREDKQPEDERDGEGGNEEERDGVSPSGSCNSSVDTLRPFHTPTWLILYNTFFISIYAALHPNESPSTILSTSKRNICHTRTDLVISLQLYSPDHRVVHHFCGRLVFT